MGGWKAMGGKLWGASYGVQPMGPKTEEFGGLEGVQPMGCNQPRKKNVEISGCKLWGATHGAQSVGPQAGSGANDGWTSMGCAKGWR